MEPSVNISDVNSLDELQEAQRFASDSIMKVVAHVNEFLDSMIRSMEDQKKMLEEQVKEAKERLEQAEKDYSECLNSQEYDEEDHCYHPSCDIEAADVDSCREEYDKLKDNDDKAERILNDSKSELSKYHEPGGILTPPGGEALMKYLATEHTDKANEKLDKIKECVSKYLSVSCGINDARTERSVEQEQLYEEGLKEQEEKAEADEVQAKKERAKAFQNAQERLQKKMSEMGYRPANAIAICPGCKRPVNVCICQHILERCR